MYFYLHMHVCVMYNYIHVLCVCAHIFCRKTNRQTQNINTKSPLSAVPCCSWFKSWHEVVQQPHFMNQRLWKKYWVWNTGPLNTSVPRRHGGSWCSCCPAGFIILKEVAGATELPWQSPAAGKTVMDFLETGSAWPWASSQSSRTLSGILRAEPCGAWP